MNAYTDAWNTALHVIDLMRCSIIKKPDRFILVLATIATRVKYTLPFCVFMIGTTPKMLQPIHVTLYMHVSRNPINFNISAIICGMSGNKKYIHSVMFLRLSKSFTILKLAVSLIFRQSLAFIYDL